MTIDSQSTALIENDEAADPPEWVGQVKKENETWSILILRLT